VLYGCFFLDAFLSIASRKTAVDNMYVLLSWTREINHNTKNMIVSVMNTKRGKLFYGKYFLKK
jgi:hypothetical protein